MSVDRQTPPSPTATNLRTALLAALEFAALVLALVFTDAPVWAVAAVIGAAVTGTLIRDRLFRPRPEWWAVVLIPVAAVLCGFAAIGIDETFSGGAHEYEAAANVYLTGDPQNAIPETLEAQDCDRQTCLSEGDTVKVVCFRRFGGSGTSWAKLDLDEYRGAYVPADLLAVKSEPAPFCGGTGTQAPQP